MDAPGDLAVERAPCLAALERLVVVEPGQVGELLWPSSFHSPRGGMR